VTGDFGYLNCQRDVMLELQTACSGRRSCQIRVDDTAFRRVSPCHRDLKSHLTVSYRCTTGNSNSSSSFYREYRVLDSIGSFSPAVFDNMVKPSLFQGGRYYSFLLNYIKTLTRSFCEALRVAPIYVSLALSQTPPRMWG